MKLAKAFQLTAGLAASALVLSACGGSEEPADGSGGAAGEEIKIGINQFVTHPSLDAVAEGFKAGMEAAGYEDVEYDEQNPQADQATNTAIAGQFAADGDLDLALAIATPSAQASAQALSDVPVLFSAVTDPVEAKLVDSLEAPGANVTGTSDKNPVMEQLELIQQFAPDAESVGIVYSSGEVNSEVQVKWAKEAAEELGLTIEETAISAASEVQQAAASLDVDAFYVPTDNQVVSALEGLLQVAGDKEVPVISADGESVKRGALATYGINYEKLGEQTAQMAVRILEGEDPATMPVEELSEVELYVNTAAAENLGLEVPQELLDEAAEVYEATEE
ncbi:ABC transporter substrate-binding protein [Zhihengliuella flava]|uniref:ABC transport system substrate-binding protein n=1 Tax=Zhihengliuella flava TaxID=1285193 RepID=A0A931D7T1_9MICC|nr:ABC transporter substrate-binding protein [Zhihengliuella flava]MBG6083652.1 putative ABC transport system substrate-binding protein [Zhihengliuella flava]